MRQEMEQMRETYERRSKNPGEMKAVTELEEKLTSTKAYYQKRIRELEDKYKFRVPDKASPTTTPP